MKRMLGVALVGGLVACAPATGQGAAEAKADLFRFIDTWRTPQDLGPANLERAFDIDLAPEGKGRAGSRSLDGGELTIRVAPEGSNFRASVLFPLPEPGQACVLTIGELVEGLKARGHEALLSQVHGLRRSWSFPSEPRGGYVLSVYAITEPEAKSEDDTAPCVSMVRLFSMEATRGQAVP